MDKATLPRGANTHIAINQIISARTRPNLIRLLDIVSFELLINLIFYLDVCLSMVVVKFQGYSILFPAP